MYIKCTYGTLTIFKCTVEWRSCCYTSMTTMHLQNFPSSLTETLYALNKNVPVPPPSSPWEPLLYCFL